MKTKQSNLTQTQRQQLGCLLLAALGLLFYCVVCGAGAITGSLLAKLLN